MAVGSERWRKKPKPAPNKKTVLCFARRTGERRRREEVGEELESDDRDGDGDEKENRAEQAAEQPRQANHQHTIKVTFSIRI